MMMIIEKYSLEDRHNIVVLFATFQAYVLLLISIL